MESKRNNKEIYLFVGLFVLVVIFEVLYDIYGGKGWIGIEIVEFLKTHTTHDVRR